MFAFITDEAECLGLRECDFDSAMTYARILSERHQTGITVFVPKGFVWLEEEEEEMHDTN